MRFRLLIIMCCALLCSWTANAFVIEGPRKSTGDPVEDLRRAPRWAPTEGALVDTGSRGLGGGLEYSIDDSICNLNFVDGADCAAARHAIVEAMEIWGQGHPSLNFTDVTGKIAPTPPRRGVGQGAEIDVFAMSAAEFPMFATALTNGYTIHYTRGRAGLMMTNGNWNAGAEGALESADVRINQERCYYIDPYFDRPQCVHFPSLMLHEIGHALGLSHPDDKPRRNLDNDDDPANALYIDCNEPTRGLKVSGKVQGAAVLVGRDVQGAGRWQRGLTYDDAAARDALYPNCDVERPIRFTHSWGAYARGESGREGSARMAFSREEAEAAALNACRGHAGAACRLIDSFTGCFAYAESFRSDESAWASATDERSLKARIDAVEKCNAQGVSCRVHRDFCAFK